jgi:hypothetical protein
MPFMSAAVAYAIQSNKTYQQTGIDDLESLVWLLLWFFFHYTPRAVGDGWEPCPYQDDVASRPSMSAEPATPRMKLLPSVLSPGPTAGSTSRKRSLADSGSSRKRARSGLPRDPLVDFISSYSSAKNMKGFLKLSGSFPPHLHRGWNSIAVARLFVEIWSLEGWQALLPRIPGFSPIDMRLPEKTTDKERMLCFSELVQKLKGIFQLAAQQAAEYYPDTGNPDQ